MQVMNHCIPQFYLKSRKNLPWLSKLVIQAMRKRNTLFRAAKKSQSTATYQKYRAARNRVVALLRLNKKKFFRGLGQSSVKEFWRAIKLLNRQETSIPPLVDNHNKVESSYDKAVLLNTYFYKCFNKTVPPPNNHYLYLNPISQRSCCAQKRKF